VDNRVSNKHPLVGSSERVKSVAMAKYDPLRDLLHLGDDRELMFDEVADLVGGLPSSAYRHQEWWSNETDGRHVQARAWLDAGMQVESVDLAARRVRLVRLADRP
jgi:hypothetical protein